MMIILIKQLFTYYYATLYHIKMCSFRSLLTCCASKQSLILAWHDITLSVFIYTYNILTQNMTHFFQFLRDKLALTHEHESGLLSTYPLKVS